MIKTVDNCVGCNTIFGNCMGTSCPNHARRALVCDICDCEAERLYKVDGKEICEECLLEYFDSIDEDNIQDNEQDYEPEWEERND